MPNQMHWVVHLICMDYVRLIKRLFYRELQLSKRPRFRTKKRFKNVVKNNLRNFVLMLKTWSR